jgi:predicted lipoprotein
LVEGAEVQPDLDDTARSGHALSRIKHNLIGMQRLFNGAEQQGFDDYLNFLGANYEDATLADALNQRFDAAIEALDAIESPLYQAVADEPEAVLAAYEAIQNLYILIRVDMSSQLSILVTFSDTDGDS